MLACFDFTPAIQADVTYYRATGHKYDSESEENMEWMETTLAGWMDYNGLVYVAGGVFGASNGGTSTPVTHGSSAVAKDWIFTPPITGSIVPQTLTWQQGDSNRARQFAYGLFTDFGYKIDRKSTTASGKMLGQLISEGISLTPSPTTIALAPVVGKQVNVYLDSTSAALGTTQLLRLLSLDYGLTGMYGPFWTLNRANASFAAHVDLPPKATVKLKVEADAVGMALLATMQQGSTQYLRVNAQGKVIDNLQTVALGGPSGGTFTLTYKAQTTATIAYNAAASAVQSALIALSTVGAGNVTVTGATGGPYSVVFGGTLAQDTTAMTGNGSGLTGGTLLVTQNQSYNTLQHDMALKIGKPAAYGDDQGIFAIEWECTVIEDASWNSGQSQVLTLTNLLTAL